MADRLLCEARHHHAGWRKPERFRRQDGSAKYPDEKWEPRPGWIGRGRLRSRTQPSSCTQHAALRTTWFAGDGLSRNRRKRNFCCRRSRILSGPDHGRRPPANALGERPRAGPCRRRKHDREKTNSLRTNPLFLDRNVRFAAALCRRFQRAADSGRSARHLREEKVSGALLSRRQAARDPALQSDRSRSGIGQERIAARPGKIARGPCLNRIRLEFPAGCCRPEQVSSPTACEKPDAIAVQMASLVS